MPQASQNSGLSEFPDSISLVAQAIDFGAPALLSPLISLGLYVCTHMCVYAFLSTCLCMYATSICISSTLFPKLCYKISPLGQRDGLVV